ncbi:type II secretion system F family protein [Vibrio mimicus]|uniref:type II secretion system F family protein n=1 Tax=Vibrio mimicus TaxID=674 RepID=UPI002F948B13
MSWYGTLVFIIVASIISLVITHFALRSWDRTKATISTRKIIGSTREEKNRFEFVYSLLNMVSFNQDETKKKLVKAGIYNQFIARSYYLFKIIPFGLCAFFSILAFLSGKTDETMLVVFLAIGAIVFLLGPDMYIAARGKKITKKISSRLPFLLDLMNVCVHTGMTIEACLEYLAFELRTVDHHLAYVVKKTVERSKLVGLEKALNEFYDLVPTAEAQSFVMTMTQSLKYGSSIGPVLATLASDIREMNMMDLEEKIGKMGAKMSIPLIAFIMVPIIILIAAPGIMRMFSHG